MRTSLEDHSSVGWFFKPSSSLGRFTKPSYVAATPRLSSYERQGHAVRRKQRKQFREEWISPTVGARHAATVSLPLDGGGQGGGDRATFPHPNPPPQARRE